MKREHRGLRKFAQQLDMSEGLWIMLCILENIHGLKYAERAARKWAMAKKREVRAC